MSTGAGLVHKRITFVGIATLEASGNLKSENGVSMNPTWDFEKILINKSSRWIAAGAAISVLVGLWILYAWIQARHQEMSEQPKMLSSSLAFEPRVSSVVASISFPYSVIQIAANSQKAQLTGAANGSDEIKCVSSDFPRLRECLTTNWHVNYSPDGDVIVARSGDFVRITLPAKFDGGAGFGGDIARLISARNKSFNGAFVLTVDALVKLDDRFCPKLTPGSATFNWTTPPSVQLIGRSSFSILGVGFSVGPWNLDVSSYITDPIRAKLNTALLSANTAIPCDPVRAELAKVWRRYSLPINVSPPVYLLAEPTEISAAMLPEDKLLRLNAMLKAKVEIATSPGKEDSLGDLPPHAPLAMQPGLLDVALPLQVDYAVVVSEAMKSFAGKSFDIEGIDGKSNAVVQSLELYPSGNKLAVGVTFVADLPSQFFDVSGTIWLSGEPVVDPTGKILSLKDVAITRKLDNGLWSVLSAAFQNTIKSEIQKNLRYDLSADEAKAIQDIQIAIADSSKTGGVQFLVEDFNIKIGRVGVGEKSFYIEALLDAKWDATIGEIQL